LLGTRLKGASFAFADADARAGAAARRVVRRRVDVYILRVGDLIKGYKTIDDGVRDGEKECRGRAQHRRRP
jgi:hypothetical protein